MYVQQRTVVPCAQCVLLLALAACGGRAAPEPAAAPAPEPVVVEAPRAPEPEPDFTLEERLARPFAVRASGRPAPRVPRSVVLAEPPARPSPSPAPAADTARTAPPPAATPPRAAAPPARPTAHTVAGGETFLAVARRYGLSYSQLLAANPGIEPDRIRPGQTLRIPPAPAAATPAPAPPARPAARRTHTVTQGETLWAIARRYGVTPERIRAANQLQGDQVRIGQTLVIPDAD